MRRRTRCLGQRGRHRPQRLRRTRRLRSRRRPPCLGPTQTPIGRLPLCWTRQSCWKTFHASSGVPWGRVWSWFSCFVRPRLDPAGASAGGAVALDAATRQLDDQTQADKDQLRLITETHPPRGTHGYTSTALRYHCVFTFHLL